MSLLLFCLFPIQSSNPPTPPRRHFPFSSLRREMMAALAASPGAPACCLQLRLLRRPQPPPPRVRLLHLSSARLRLCAGSPASDSLAGWSDGKQGDGDDQKKLPTQSVGAVGAHPQGFLDLDLLASSSLLLLPLPCPPSEETMEQGHKCTTCLLILLPWKLIPMTLAKRKRMLINSPHRLLTQGQMNSQRPSKQTRQYLRVKLNEKRSRLSLFLSGTTFSVKKLINFDAAGGTASPLLSPPLPATAGSEQVAYSPSSKLGGGAVPSKEIPNLEETSDSRVALSDNHHLHVTSDAVVLDSNNAVRIQQISNSALKDKTIEQNKKIYSRDEASSSSLSDYIEYESANMVSPLSSNDLPTEENSKPGEVEEILAGDHDEKENALENQRKIFKSISPDQSLSSARILALSLASSASHVPAGQIVIPATVEPTQENAISALQILKVIEPNARAGDLCTRREYARWLVVASNFLSRNTFSKVYPAMYIDNVTELAFDDITPKDPDFPCIQGLAEAGLISSKLSRSDMNDPDDIQNHHNLFLPESPLSRQDLVSWKIALDRRQLPEVDRNGLFEASGYIDIDKINSAAWPALVADLGAGDHSITALAFGFTRLFQPYKPVTKGQAALAISTGDSTEVVLEELARIEAEKIAEAAVNAHGALVVQVEKDVNANFERELTKEREKVETLEKLAEEARTELDNLRAEREDEKNTLLRDRAAVESEMEVLLKLRSEVEKQLQSVLSKKVEISFEKSRIEKLQKEIENENLAVVQLQYELEVERKALSMARAWAEEEARKAREHVRALEEARNQWARQGIKVIVEGGLEDEASVGVTWANVGKEHPVDEAISRAESLLEKLKSISFEMKVRSCGVLDRVMQHLSSFIASLKQRAANARQQCAEFGVAAVSKANKLAEEVQCSASAFGSTIRYKSKRVIEECKEGLDKFAHRFKTD